MSDVFISYARSTATQAQRIADALRALGYDVWRDDDLPAHRPYADVIDERLRSAKAVVVIWSAEAAKSQWVRAEADLARNLGTLVQLRIDDTTPPLPFNQIECADLSGWKGDPNAQGWRKIVGSVAELLGAPAPERAQAPRAAAPQSRRFTPRRIGIAAGALALVVALVGFAVWRLGPHGPTPIPGQNGRVNVVAFDPQGTDPALRKVADDTQPTLVRILAGAGVQTAAVPKGQDTTGDAELRIAGTVAREGENFVTNAQILDRKSGVILWTDRIVRTPKEQDAAPEGVAHSVAAILHCAMEDRRSAPSALTTEVFGLYLNACAALFFGGGDDAGRMLTVTRRLVKVAPKFAGAHAMHAVAAAFAANQVENSPAEAAEAAAMHAESKAAAEEAIRLDPRTPKAYTALALNEGVYGNKLSQNWLLEDQSLQKALAIDRDLPPARVEYLGLLRSTGRLDEAIAFAKETSGSGDPRNSPDDVRLALMLAAKGDAAGAEALLQKAEAVSRISQQHSRWTIAFWWEEPKTALAKIEAAGPGGQTAQEARCYLTYLRQLQAPTSAGIRGLPASCDSVVDPGWRVRMLAREGDLDGAFAAFKPPMPGGTLLLFYPEMKAFRRDPRFWPLVTRLGLSDYWAKSNHWPDFCSEPDLPYNCRAMAAAAKP